MNQTSFMEHMRLSQVKRYPICHTNREQSVAEHTFGVLYIARELARATGYIDVIEAVTDYAITHDMDEIYTGDIPSGFKRRLRAEFPGVTRVLDGEKPPKTIEGIVKMADYLEAMYYLREFGGSRFSSRVLGDIESKFADAMATIIAADVVDQRAVRKAEEIYRWIS